MRDIMDNNRLNHYVKFTNCIDAIDRPKIATYRVVYKILVIIIN